MIRLDVLKSKNKIFDLCSKLTDALTDPSLKTKNLRIDLFRTRRTRVSELLSFYFSFSQLKDLLQKYSEILFENHDLKELLKLETV